MKNFIKLFVIVAIVAAIGFAVVSCGGDKCPGNCGLNRPPLGSLCETSNSSCGYENGCTCE